MSATISDKKITMTRGDTLLLKIGIERDGEDYTPEEGDVIRFAVKRQEMNADRSEYADRTPLIEKTVPNDTLVLELAPEDTKALGFGKYDYDIELTFADGRVDTFIAGVLRLTKEVE